ncbi:unnamed protein product [Mesocestoides corti]|uniref:Uncharacterized protein n=1 Tax=Mesocestoides corti TaxID=53468 RepID=A0A0R3U9T4_MESCO|nr:unnamed protein product [Mesocestoides corti]
MCPGNPRKWIPWQYCQPTPTPSTHYQSNISDGNAVPFGIPFIPILHFHNPETRCPPTFQQSEEMDECPIHPIDLSLPKRHANNCRMWKPYES